MVVHVPWFACFNVCMYHGVHERWYECVMVCMCDDMHVSQRAYVTVCMYHAWCACVIVPLCHGEG